MNTAILISNLGHNQLSHETINSLHLASENNLLTNDVIVMYENKVNMPSQYPFAQMHISEIYGYIGNVVATSIGTVAKLLSVPIHGKKYFYIYNFEWIRHIPFRYEPLMSLICDKNIELICRTEEHGKLIENNFNRKPIATLSSMNITNLLEIINGIKC